MNKTAIKNFAIWARNKLIAEITYKAGLLGITEKEIKSPLPQSTQTVKFFDIGTKEPYSIAGVEIEQRKKLAEEIHRKAKKSDYKTAYQSLVEEVAYTWFNRLIAVRFMEVNDYLPTSIRVLSSESSNKSEPDLVTNPMNADLDYTAYEKDRIVQLKNENQLDELFRMLFIKQCNALNSILPALFEKTNDFTELLMNVSFTDQDGVVYHLIHDISEADFNVSKEGQVEIIGWMYQYYNTEPKGETFALLKKNVKINKQRIPAATQLFTPDWIVRYMVENSLGRLWVEGHPNDTLKSQWKYYLDEADQEVDVQVQLAAIREEYKAIMPEDIKVIDPCMGSGHMLVYAFDVLMQIYESYGYSQRDAAKNIIEKNIYGLDIDNRAYQLAYFAVTMKARQYNRRILKGKISSHVYAIQESNGINREQLKYFGVGLSDIEKNSALTQMQYLLDTMHDAKEYGSILNINQLDLNLLYRFVGNVGMDEQLTLDAIGLDDTQKQLIQLVEIVAVMTQKYDVVVTNPPYMGNKGMDAKLTEFVQKEYFNSKLDLFAVFIQRCIQLTKKNRYQAMITQHSWMFLASFATMREEILCQTTITNMAHLGARAFDEIGGEVVQTVAFVLNNSAMDNYNSSFSRLVKYNSQDEKERGFFNKDNIYIAQAKQFFTIPNKPVAYWIEKGILSMFSNYEKIGDVYQTKLGMSTNNNNRFLRFWYEVNLKETYFSRKHGDKQVYSEKWFPYSKGGGYRKWYGNFEYLINWYDNGFEVKELASQLYGSYSRTCKNTQFFFKNGLTWGLITPGVYSCRYLPEGFVLGDAGPMCFSEDDNYYVLGYLNSGVVSKILSIINPTINCSTGVISAVPICPSNVFRKQIVDIVVDNIFISKDDSNSFETSWDFLKHPFLLYNTDDTINNAFKMWSQYKETQFMKLKANEEEVNRVFISIFELQEELNSEVDDKDVSVRKADINRDIRSFISYVVGCMFGRYSIDIDGLAYAGGEWDVNKYSTFIPDRDNILPITDEEYFEDDVVGLLYTFLKKTFGTENLEENLDFIAKALGNKGNSSREIIRSYFLKDFFKDHCKIYKKRPIYWQFDSGKADGFKAIVYMHRYNEDTIGNLRIDYLHRMQRIYESEILRMQEIIENSKDAREMTAATKRKEKLVKQLKETKEYDEKIAHLALARIAIDLDDGVKVNYEKIQTDTDGKKLAVLAKI